MAHIELTEDESLYLNALIEKDTTNAAHYLSNEWKWRRKLMSKVLGLER